MTKKKESCDSRIWCAECKQGNYTTIGEKYLCVACGKVLHLDHEVHHEGFPHISGDTDNQS